MKLDAGGLRRVIAAPPSGIRLYLFFGPDEAGAADAARRLAAAIDPAPERVDLDGATLRKDPGRLADEAASLSLFGGSRSIRVTGVGDESLEAVTLLLAAQRPEHPVIALAPGLRATARLAKLVLDAPLAYACAFYEPSAADAERIAHDLAREAGLQPDRGIARDLADACGHDRAVIAREIEKLALYLDAAPDRPHVLDRRAIDAVGADLHEAAQAELVAAIVDGEPAALGLALDRLAAEAGSPIPWLRAVVRRLLALADMRSAIDAGEAPAVVMKKHRVFFREEAATLAALRRWTPAMLSRAIGQLRAAERAVMATGNAGPVVADTAAMTIARGLSARR